MQSASTELVTSPGAGDAAKPPAPDSQIRVTYARTSQAPERKAIFANGESVRIRTGRIRAYPGLPSEAPPTIPLYVLANEELPDGARVLDVGCGAGMGTRLLTARSREVTGVDASGEAVAFARHFVGGAVVKEADASASLPAMSIDAAVFIDVLAHMKAPFDALAAVHERLHPGSAIFVAEPSAHPEQCLRAPVRRAFSQRALTSLLAATGYEVTKWHSTGTFLTCTATYVEDPAVQSLVAATRTHDAKWALALYEDAKKSARPAVVLEALLGAAESYVTLGNGDGACRSLFDARALAPEDPRPAVGLSRVALLTRNFDDAKTMAEVAIKLDPTEASAHAMLALARDATGESSVYAWRLAVNLCPDDAGFVARLVDAAAVAGDTKLGVHAAERLRGYHETSGAAQVTYAKALLKDGREADARLEIQVAMKEDSKDPFVKGTLDQLRAACVTQRP